MSADMIWEILCWLDWPADWRWLVLLLASLYDLRRPLPLMSVGELSDRGHDAFVSLKYAISAAGRVLPNMELSADTLLGRTIVVYGPSSSGRGRVTKHIINQLRAKAVEVYNMTEHNVASVLNAQEWRIEAWERANQPAVLASLFERVSEKQKQKAAQALKQVAGGDIHATAVIHKQFIGADYPLLSRQKDLNKDERLALAYLDQKYPDVVVVFDESFAGKRTLFKTLEFRTIFFQGRFKRITAVCSFQDDTDLDINLRKNALVSIFCDNRTCRQFFAQPSNRFPPDTQEVARDVAPAVLKGSRVLAFVRNRLEGGSFFRATVPSGGAAPSFSDPARANEGAAASGE